MSRFSSLYLPSHTSNPTYRGPNPFRRPTAPRGDLREVYHGLHSSTQRYSQSHSHVAQRHDPYYDTAEYQEAEYERGYHTGPTFSNSYSDPNVEESYGYVEPAEYSNFSSHTDDYHDQYNANTEDYYDQYNTYSDTSYTEETEQPQRSFDYGHGGVKSSIDGHVTPMAFRRGRISQIHVKDRGSFHSKGYLNISVPDKEEPHDTSWSRGSVRGHGPRCRLPRGLPFRGRGSHDRDGLPKKDSSSFASSQLCSTEKQNSDIPDLVLDSKNVSKSKSSEATVSSVDSKKAVTSQDIKDSVSVITSDSSGTETSSEKVYPNPNQMDSNTSVHQTTFETSSNSHIENTMLSLPEQLDQSDEEEDEDTGFCKYCGIDFKTADSYWKHTRGMLHIQKMMGYEERRKKGSKSDNNKEKDSPSAGITLGSSISANLPSKPSNTILNSDVPSSTVLNSAVPKHEPDKKNILKTEKENVASFKEPNTNSDSKSIGDTGTSKPENLISSFAQSLLSSAKSNDCVIKPKYEMPPFHRPPQQQAPPHPLMAQRFPGPRQQGPESLMSNKSHAPLIQGSPSSNSQNSSECKGQTTSQSSMEQFQHYQNNKWSHNETQSESKGEDNQDGEDDEEEIDTGYCLYCDIHFTNPDSYWKHTRGIQHTQYLMDYERKKREEGEQFFKTEIVDAGPKEEKRDALGRKILSAEERRQIEEDKRKAMQNQIKLLLASTGEGSEGKYDFNKANWMELDPQHKPGIPAKDKDFNPSDLGKEQFPDEFYCEICDVKCTGSVTFKMHMEGNKHKTKEKAASNKKISFPSNMKIIPCDKPALINKSLETIPDPIIGLQYVTEFQRQEDRPRYVCNMCESRCDNNSILSHIVGLKHRLKYFKEHYPDSYQKMVSFSSKKKSEQNGFAEEFARDVEAQEGRQDVKVKLEVDISTELAAADLIKSGVLDHLLEGTGLTKEKLQHLDVDSLRPTVQETVKEKIEPIIKQDKDRSVIEKTQKERFLQGGTTHTRLLPSKEEREQILSNRPGKSRQPLPERSYPPQRNHSEDFDERFSRGYPDRRTMPDPYYQRREDPYYVPRFPGYGSPMEEGGFKPVVVDYGHSKTPVKEVKPLIMDYGHNNKPDERTQVLDYRHSPGSREGSLGPNNRTNTRPTQSVIGPSGVTEEERATMKRDHREFKTEEELFQEFIKWKKAKINPANTADQHTKQSTVTSDNYQFQPTTSTPMPVMEPGQQPTDLPSYSTSDQSKHIKGGKGCVNPPFTMPKLDLSSKKDLPPQAQELLATLSKSMIASEDEAAMALQVSNALTQALLEYQLKSISQELQNTVQQQQEKQKTMSGSKIETSKKLTNKKERFDAYSMLESKSGTKSETTTAPEQTLKTSATKTKGMVSAGNVAPGAVTSQIQTMMSTGNIAPGAATRQIPTMSFATGSEQNMYLTSQNMTDSMYQPTQEMTSQSYDPSAQAMMMSSQGMMPSSMPMAGYQVQTGTAAYDMNSYQQFQNAPSGYTMPGQAFPGSMVPPPMGLPGSVVQPGMETGFTCNVAPPGMQQAYAGNLATPGIQQGFPGNFAQPPMDWNQFYGAPQSQPVPPPLPPLPTEEYPKPPPPPE